MSELGNWGLPLGSIKDRHLDYVQKRVWIPASQFIQGQISGVSTVLTTDIAGVVGNIANVNASGMGGIKFTATTENTDLFWRIPYDFDNRHALRLRYLWTSDFATANGTATIRALYTVVKTGAAPTAGATALTSAIGVSTKTAATADALYFTPWGVIGMLSTGAGAYQVFDDNAEVLAVRTNVNAVGGGLTLATNFVFVMGMEIAYTPKLTFGDGSRREARWTESNLGFGAADPAVQPF